MTMTSARLGEAETERIARVRQLAALGTDALAPLIEALGDRNWVVRRAVVEALAQLGDVATPGLCAALETRRDDEARIAALVDTLASVKGHPERQLWALLDHPSPALVADAAQILGRRRSRSSVPRLAQLAQAKDENVAVAAIEALGRIGGKAAVETLIQAVRSGSFFRTFPAIDVLGRTGDPRVIAPLAELLDDPRYASEAARALGKTADPGAVHPLLRLFAHPSDAFVRVAAVALSELRASYAARYGASDAVDLLLQNGCDEALVRRAIRALAGADGSEQQAFCDVLGAMGSEESVPALTARLDAPEGIARAAAQALRRLGTRGALSLSAALRDGDSGRRKLVLGVLTPKVLAADDLIVCLRDPDGTVRATAAELLGQIGDTSAVTPLFELLGDPNARVQQAAAGALHALGGDVTERLTLAAANHTDRRVRREALRLLGQLGYVSGIDVLRAAVAGDDEQVREVALYSLGLLETPAALDALRECTRAELPRTRAAAVRALGQRSLDEARELLLPALDDPDAWVRYYAAQSLGRLRAEEAAARLAALLADEAGQVRIAAIEALAQLESPTALEALAVGVRSADADGRRAGWMGLSHVRRAELLPLVIEATASDEPPTRLVAASALATFDGEQAENRLGEIARSDPDDGVRSAALAALAERHGAHATTVLISLLDDACCQNRASAALARPLPGRIEGVLASLEQADDELAAQLTSALARMRTRDAHAALGSALGLESPIARRAAVITAAAVGGRALNEALQRLFATETDAEVRRVLASALRG